MGSKHHFELLAQAALLCLLFVACFSSSVATGAKRGRWKDAGGKMAAKKTGVVFAGENDADVAL